MTNCHKKEKIKNRLLEALDQYRSIIIDPVEQELGETENWRYLRSRLLKALGDRGLAGRMRDIIDAEIRDDQTTLESLRHIRNPISVYRKKNKISQEDLAAISGVNLNKIRLAENGHKVLLNEELEAICNSLKIDMQDVEKFEELLNMEKW